MSKIIINRFQAFTGKSFLFRMHKYATYHEQRQGLAVSNRTLLLDLYQATGAVHSTPKTDTLQPQTI